MSGDEWIRLVAAFLSGGAVGGVAKSYVDHRLERARARQDTLRPLDLARIATLREIASEVIALATTTSDRRRFEGREKRSIGVTPDQRQRADRVIAELGDTDLLWAWTLFMVEAELVGFAEFKAGTEYLIDPDELLQQKLDVDDSYKKVIARLNHLERHG